MKMNDVVKWIPKVGVTVGSEERIVRGEGHSSKSKAWREAERIAEQYGSAAAWVGVGRVVDMVQKKGCHFVGIPVP
jgi:hypothetical protein